MRVKANNVMIRNNNVALTLGAAVWVSADLVYDYEGYFVNNFTITGNTIDRSIRGKFLNSFADTGHITIEVFLTGSFKPAGTPIILDGKRVSGGITLHKNIVIEGNTVTSVGPLERQLAINAVSGITIKGNTFISPVTPQTNMEFASCAGVDVQPDNVCKVNGVQQACNKTETP
jgi:hypothetical protein